MSLDIYKVFVKCIFDSQQYDEGAQIAKAALNLIAEKRHESGNKSEYQSEYDEIEFLGMKILMLEEIMIK